MYFVYELVDPRTDLPGYVGITNNPNARFKQHISIQNTNKHKDEWIDQLSREGVQPQMKIVNIVEEEQQARKCERKLVQKYLQQGIQITNIHWVASSSNPSPKTLPKSCRYRVKEVRSIQQYKQEYGACGAQELSEILGITVEELLLLANASHISPMPEGWVIETKDIVYKTTDEKLFKEYQIDALRDILRRS